MSDRFDQWAKPGIPDYLQDYFPPLIPNSAVERCGELSDDNSSDSPILTYVRRLNPETLTEWDQLLWSSTREYASSGLVFHFTKNWADSFSFRSTDPSRFTASIRNWNETPSLFLTYNHPVATRNYDLIVEHALRHTAVVWHSTMCADQPASASGTALIRPTPKSKFLLPGDSYRRLTLGPIATFEPDAVDAAMELLSGGKSGILSWQSVVRLVEFGGAGLSKSASLRRAIRSLPRHQPPVENCGPSEPGVPHLALLTASNVHNHAPPKAFAQPIFGRGIWPLELLAAA